MMGKPRLRFELVWDGGGEGGIGLVCNHHGVMMGDGAGIARGFVGRGAGLRARRGVVGEKCH
jgi:hypothetical protein